MRIHSIVLASLLAACVGAAPDDTGGNGPGNGNGNGNGDGNGDGDGDGGDDGDGDGGGTGEGTGGGGMTATQFLTQISQKFCDQAFSCKASFPAEDGVTFEDVFGATAQQCTTESTAGYEPSLVEQQITAGKIQWNPTDAAACLAGITFGACNVFWTNEPTLPQACDTALVGTIADGQTCVTHMECSNLEAYCDDTTKKCTVDTAGRAVAGVPSSSRPARLANLTRQ